MKRFYVASSFRNIVNVRYVAQTLESKGYVNTYDWTQNAPARDAGAITLGDLRSIGQHERDAVIGADVVVILLPGGKGTHVELGIAIAQGRRTILHSPDEVINNLETTSTFYHLPELEKCHGTLDDLLATIVGQFGSALARSAAGSIHGAVAPARTKKSTSLFEIRDLILRVRITSWAVSSSGAPAPKKSNAGGVFRG